MTTPVLPLPLYRNLLALDEPWRAPPPAPAGDRAALVTAVVEALQPGALAVPGAARPRALLQALLTQRPPTPPLPEEVLSSLDRLLQGERLEKEVTDARALLRLSRSFGPQAARCALWRGDITTLAVDAITNAANAPMLGCFVPFHACIDNAIHSAAGPRLREDCAKLMDAQGHDEPTGFAKATRAYDLPSRFVLHTVGPIVGEHLEPAHERLLASCYREVLDTAAQLPGVRSVALCGISTGVFGYPKGPAARLALRTVGAWLEAHPGALDLVVFNVFSADDERVYLDALAGGALHG